MNFRYSEDDRAKILKDVPDQSRAAELIERLEAAVNQYFDEEELRQSSRSDAESARAWADIRWEPGDEKFSDRQRYAVVPATVRTRYEPDVSVLDRVVIESEIYGIKGVSEIGRREGTELKIERTT